MNVEIMPNGTISIPRGPLEKDEALRLAAAILHTLEETDFGKVKAIISDLHLEKKLKEIYLDNIKYLRDHKYVFEGSQDVWYKIFAKGHVIVTRAMLSDEHFQSKLNTLEMEKQMAVEL